VGLHIGAWEYGVLGQRAGVGEVQPGSGGIVRDEGGVWHRKNVRRLLE
jgi:hypothetical protein